MNDSSPPRKTVTGESLHEPYSEGPRTGFAKQPLEPISVSWRSLLHGNKSAARSNHDVLSVDHGKSTHVAR